jgi:uncharacterized membrane protein YphA (DoxX/SURF4 family)
VAGSALVDREDTVLLRRLARPLFASWFVSEGVDVLRSPGRHVADARAALDRLNRRLPAQAQGTPVASALATPLTDAQLTAIVRAHGGALAVGGVLLGLGRAPRTVSFVLAILTAPLVLVALPDKRADGGDKILRRVRRARLVRAAAFTGGAVLAGADSQGRPSIGWRVQHARDEHAKAKAHEA